MFVWVVLPAESVALMLIWFWMALTAVLATSGMAATDQVPVPVPGFQFRNAPPLALLAALK